MSDPRLHQIALTRIPGIGPKIGKQLVAYCGGVEAVFEERKSHLLRIPGIGEAVAHEIINSDTSVVEEDLVYIDKHGIQIAFYLDEHYPRRLTHVDDGPLMLYSKGKFEAHPNRTVAIVGTRKPTPYGKSLVEELVHDLNPYGVQIISGLAYGIDSAAHRAACSNVIENLAVMGTGIDQLYPSSHRELANKICKKGGLISEYHLRARADRENFPRRNRVIAAMADVVIVVQSAARGGSLITGEFGNQYHKDVFAFPGRLKDEAFAGCNALIKQHKAHLLTSVKDIAYIMRWEVMDQGPKVDVQQELFVELNPQEEKIVNLLKTVDQGPIDWLHHELKISMGELSSLLLSLEFKGVINTLPGKCYQAVK